MGCGACKGHELGITLLSSVLHSLYVSSPCNGPGTEPGDGDIRINMTWFLPQEDSSKGEAPISKYIINQCSKCSEIYTLTSWEHMIKVKGGELWTQAGSGRWRYPGRLS